MISYEDFKRIQVLEASYPNDKSRYLKPVKKLPDCPRCGEDELAMVNSYKFACLFCGYIPEYEIQT